MNIELLPERMKIPTGLLRKGRHIMPLIFSMFFVFFSEPIYSNAEKNDFFEKEKISLINALQQLSKDYQVFFSYDQEVVRNIEVNFEPEEYTGITHALDEMLLGTSLKYKMFNNRYIILYERSPEALSSLRGMVEHLETVIDTEEKESAKKINHSPVAALPSRIRNFSVNTISFSLKGKVIDQEGEPLIGVNIQVKGSSKGTATDFDGDFILEDIDENAILVVSYVGYQTQEVTVAGKSSIEIILVSDSQLLDEVIVVGYSDKRRSELSSSVSIISDREISRSVSTTGLGNLLQGRVPGMQISGSSGAPGSSANMIVQGMGSITAGAAPLVVVDGIIGGNYDPKDIETITILRDAAATGLYGSRAASGVIVVTTKKGTSGDFKISVNSTIGPTYNWDDRIEVYDAEGLYEQWSRAMQNQYDLQVKNGHPDFVNKTFEEYRNSLIPPNLLDRTTDWFGMLQRPGMINHHQLSISGGNERTTFYLSGNYNYEKGTTLDIFNSQSNIRLNLSHKLSEKITTNFRITGRYDQNTPLRSYSPRFQAWDNIPFDNAFLEDGTPTPVMNTGIVPIWYHWTRNNWMMEREESEDLVKSYGGNFMGEISWQLTKGIRFNSSNRISYSGRDDTQYWSKNTPLGYTPNGYAQWRFDIGTSFITSNTLHTSKRFGVHEINGILGQEYSYDRGKYVMGRGHGMVGNLQAVSSSGNANSVGGTINETAFLSYFGQVDYDLLGKYFLVGSLRYDASSRFGANNRWGNFYSLGGNWVISKEGFLNDISWLNILKLRLSYGTTGNADIDSYLTLGTYSFSSTSRYNGESGSWPSRLENPDLTWEVARKTNFGIDFTVFNRATIEFNIYNKINDNLLQSVPLQATTGFTNVMRNVGIVSNKGFDFNLTSTNIEKVNFLWESNLNFGINKNKVEKLFNGEDIIDENLIIREGLPLRYYYLPEWVGVDPQNGLPIWIRWEDAEGNKLDGSDNIQPTEITTTNNYSEASRLPIASAYPKFTGGFSNHLEYQNFYFDVLTNFAVGQTIYNGVNWSIHDLGANRVKPTKWQKDITWWEKPGDEAKLPQMIYGDPYNSRLASSLYLEDASYLRIQKLSIGYSFKNNILSDLIKNLRLTASVENLAVLTNFSFGDSDTSFEEPITSVSRYRPTRKFLINIRFDL